MRLITRTFALLALVLALLIPGGTATAAPATSERIDMVIVDLNTCNNDEWVYGEGTARIAFKQQKDGTLVVHYNLHAEGTGDQGNEYVLNVSAKEKWSSDAFSIRAHGVLVSKGSALNQAVTIIIDSDGTYIVDILCKD